MCSATRLATEAPTQRVEKPAAEQRVAGGSKSRVGELARLSLSTQQGPNGTLSWVLAMLPLHGHDCDPGITVGADGRPDRRAARLISSRAGR